MSVLPDESASLSVLCLCFEKSLLLFRGSLCAWSSIDVSVEVAVGVPVDVNENVEVDVDVNAEVDVEVT